ncbi:MAG: hypothetical protein Marn2KO_36900 [Marinobacter nauticus]
MVGTENDVRDDSLMGSREGCCLLEGNGRGVAMVIGVMTPGEAMVVVGSGCGEGRFGGSEILISILISIVVTRIMTSKAWYPYVAYPYCYGVATKRIPPYPYRAAVGPYPYLPITVSIRVRHHPDMALHRTPPYPYMYG